MILRKYFARKKLPHFMRSAAVTVTFKLLSNVSITEATKSKKKIQTITQ